MSTALRIVLTGHDPTLSPDTVAALASEGHAVESVETGAIENGWRPRASPTVVCYGLSHASANELERVAGHLSKLPEVSFLAVVSQPDDEGLWDVLRNSNIHAVVSANAGVEEFRHRLSAANELQRLDSMAQLSSAKLERVRQTLQGFRHVDMDTGLSNRRALVERLTDMLFLSQRYKRPLSLVIFAVRNHESLAQTVSADDLSQGYEEIADQLQLAQRSSDLAARTSADCFALMLPETPEDGANIVAERMEKTLAERNAIGDGLVISSGVMASTDGEMDAREMIQTAEDLARGA